jgi:dsDNA-specific endonuclease/ATPase MutS2
MKIVSDIQFKEYLTQKELAKVKDQQEKRRTIKAIRDEAFQLAKVRKQKIDQFQRNKAEADLKLKEDRTEAIKQGQEALKQMRFDIKNAMFQTRLELKVCNHFCIQRDVDLVA